MKWCFVQNGVMKTLEYYENQRSCAFYEKVFDDRTNPTQNITDIRSYIHNVRIYFEESKKNYYENKALIKRISSVLGNNYGIGFDEYVWLQKQDSSNYVKVSLNLYLNSNMKNIRVEYNVNDDKNVTMLCEEELFTFLKKGVVFKPRKKEQPMEKREKREKPSVSVISNLDRSFKNLFVTSSSEYKLGIQTCKSPVDPYAYLLEEDHNE
jgi:hypothetical protein